MNHAFLDSEEGSYVSVWGIDTHLCTKPLTTTMLNAKFPIKTLAERNLIYTGEVSTGRTWVLRQTLAQGKNSSVVHMKPRVSAAENNSTSFLGSVNLIRDRLNHRTRPGSVRSTQISDHQVLSTGGGTRVGARV